MDLTAALILTSAFGFWLLAIAIVSPARLVAVGLFAWCLNLSWLVPPAIGVAAGAVGAMTILVAVLRARDSLAEPNHVPRALMLPLATGLLGLLLSPVAWSIRDTAQSSVGLIVMGSLLVAAVRRFDGRTLADAALWATTSAMVVSMALVVSSIGQTNYSGRALGIFANPNTLGMVSALWLALALSRSRFWIPVLPLSLWTIVQTESRGSLLAWAAALLVWVWLGGLGRHPSRGVPLPIARGLLLLSTALVVLAAVEFAPAGGLGRTGDSGRLALLHNGWQRFLDRPITGWGLGSPPIEGVSNPHVLPMTLIMQLGLAGFVVFIATVLVLLASLLSGSPGTGALGAFAFTAMIAESWHFGAGSFTAWVFWFGFAGQLSAAQQRGSGTGSDLGWRHPANARWLGTGERRPAEAGSAPEPAKAGTARMPACDFPSMMRSDS